jgi:glycerophosphoryl diester phosphodiesterase
MHQLVFGVFYYVTFVKNQSMLKIGHRGARGYEPENTLMVFKSN